MECEYLERFGEEQEKLQRSNKRVKDSSSDGGHGEEETEMGNPLPKSYKDKLLVVIPGAHAQMCIANNQQYGKEYFDNEMDEVTEEFAVVKLSKEIKSKIKGVQSNALIVKVFGRMVGYHYLHRTGLSPWKPQCIVDYLDLGNDFFPLQVQSQR